MRAETPTRAAAGRSARARPSLVPKGATLARARPGRACGARTTKARGGSRLSSSATCSGVMPAQNRLPVIAPAEVPITEWTCARASGAADGRRPGRDLQHRPAAASPAGRGASQPCGCARASARLDAGVLDRGQEPRVPREREEAAGEAHVGHAAGGPARVRSCRRHHGSGCSSAHAGAVQRRGGSGKDRGGGPAPRPQPLLRRLQAAAARARGAASRAEQHASGATCSQLRLTCGARPQSPLGHGVRTAILHEPRALQPSVLSKRVVLSPRAAFEPRAARVRVPRRVRSRTG